MQIDEVLGIRRAASGADCGDGLGRSVMVARPAWRLQDYLLSSDAAPPASGLPDQQDEEPLAQSQAAGGAAS